MTTYAYPALLGQHNHHRARATAARPEPAGGAIYEPIDDPAERFAAFHQANPASPEPSRPCAASGSHATQRWASRRSSKTFDGNRA